ncbi:MAG: ComFC protein, putative [Thermotoga sp. 50_1627]|nr:MAG: ComFC protein, putative [Thermotoga sp. 50_64]KUK23957.1 MAG: ComFC protein, putative [Thermotoga sp. 50_1627]
MNRHFETVLKVVFPNSCVLCGRAISPFWILCEDCEAELFRGPIPLVEKTKWCEVYFYGRYESLLRDAILAYKNGGHWRLSRILAKALLETMRRYSISFDVLTWVPSSFKALEERGFDTMGMIAKVVSKNMHAKCVSLIQSAALSTKRGLTRQQRRESVRGMFLLKTKPTGTVALIDDVYTTGATIDECSKLLVRAGAEKVIAYCIAKA